MHVPMRFPIAPYLAFVLLLPLAPARAVTPVDALRQRYAAIAPQLAASPYGRPLKIESVQDEGDLQGDVQAVVEHPFATLDRELRSAARWCDILILHLNTKQCVSSDTQLAVAVGRKYDQPLADAYHLNFDYRVAASAPDFLKVVLNAKDGPFGTHDYRIVVEATPLDPRHAFLHMSYAYGYGFAARMALQGYLATIGRDKVGFTVVGRQRDGQPVYVDNVRGVVERNAMRYYLAIDAYLASLAAPPGEQQERRLLAWFNATERYRRQLHEMEQADYVAMKRSELERQRVAQGK